MAATNKSLAQGNKSGTGREATNKRLRRQSGAVRVLDVRLARHLGLTMLKTLIIATVLLPTLAIAQRSQQLPQPRQPGQWCPAGWMASGNYPQERLVPGRLARERQLLHPLRVRSCEHLWHHRHFK